MIKLREPRCGRLADLYCAVFGVLGDYVRVHRLQDSQLIGIVMHFLCLVVVQLGELPHPVVILLPKEERDLAERQRGRGLRFLEFYRCLLLIRLIVDLGRDEARLGITPSQCPIGIRFVPRIGFCRRALLEHVKY